MPSIFEGQTKESVPQVVVVGDKMPAHHDDAGKYATGQHFLPKEANPCTGSKESAPEPEQDYYSMYCRPHSGVKRKVIDSRALDGADPLLLGM
jgi:hypothetical protein